MQEFAPILPWLVLSDRTLIRERWLEVREQRVRLVNGHEIEQFHLIKGPDWASVLCVTERREIVFVRQYRHGIAGPSLELPAGVIDPGEDPLTAARRELREETGFVAEHFQPLLEVSPEPARNSTRAHFFFAEPAVRVADPALENSEELSVVVLPVSDVLEAIDGGQIVHGAHIAALLWALRRGLV
jgi:8-oxo-dGTP pyrophosphatase MutT (NUDIX family)